MQVLRSRSGSDGDRGGRVQVRKRRRLRSRPRAAKGSMPAATCWDHHIRRGCQWIPGSPAAPAAGMTAEGKAWAGVAPAVRRDDARKGQGLCQHHLAAGLVGARSPLCPRSGTSPPQGGRGARVAGSRPEPADCIRTPPHPRAVTPAGAQSGGPFVARAAATGTGLPLLLPPPSSLAPSSPSSLLLPPAPSCSLLLPLLPPPPQAAPPPASVPCLTAPRPFSMDD